MTNEKILLQLEKGYDIKNPQLAQALSNLEDKIGITKAELEEAIETKANLVGGKVPAEELPSYVDDVIEFNNIQVADAEISSIIGNNLYKNQIRFVNNSTTLPDRIGSEDKYPDMFVNFGENTSEDDWTTFEPEEGKIYVNTTNNHSYRWSGSYLIDLDSNWSQGIKDLQENTVRTDSQDLSVVQQKQALENLGMKVYVTDSTFLGSTLSAEEIEEVAVSKALLFTDTGDLFLVGVLDSSKVTFARIKSNNIVDIITVTRSTGGVSLLNSYNFRDNEALHFTAQNPALTSAQQAQAFKNLGWKVYVSTSDVIIANAAIPDDVMEEIVNCQAILLSDTGKMLFKGNQSDSIIYFLTFGHNNNVQELVIRPINKTSQSLQQLPINDQYAIKYSNTQNLTNAQQDVSLHNIGLNFVHVDYSLLGTTLTDAPAQSIVNSRGIILTNVPENSVIPTVYLKGLNDNNYCYFLTINGNTIISQISFNKNTKALSKSLNTDLHFDSVRYAITQTLTDTQKQQARTNIGAASSDDVFNDYVANGGTKTTKAAMYTELAAQLNNNTVVLDNSVVNTTLSRELGDKIANATNIIFKNGTYTTYNLFKTSNTINAVNPVFVGFSEVRTECTLAILTYTASSRYLAYSEFNINSSSLSESDLVSIDSDRNIVVASESAESDYPYPKIVIAESAQPVEGGQITLTNDQILGSLSTSVGGNTVLPSRVVLILNGDGGHQYQYILYRSYTYVEVSDGLYQYVYYESVTGSYSFRFDANNISSSKILSRKAANS